MSIFWDYCYCFPTKSPLATAPRVSTTNIIVEVVATTAVMAIAEVVVKPLATAERCAIANRSGTYTNFGFEFPYTL